MIGEMLSFYLFFQHDPENNRDCTPGGEDGNYIMFARATSGDKRNNNKFSPCSLKSINGVLSAKARNEQGCFKGNYKMEGHSVDLLLLLGFFRLFSSIYLAIVLSSFV